jgi:RNA polymerase sigma factor (sigma-70 family)
LLKAERLTGAPGDSAIPAAASGAITRVIRRELDDAVTRCLAEMSAEDRAVIVLRGIEQLSAKAAAPLLGVSAEAVAMRYHRARNRLRELLPGSVADELD